MRTWTIHQDSCGDFEIEAETKEEALAEMAGDIVDSLPEENWSIQFLTNSRDDAIEFVLCTLDIVEE